MDHLEVLMRLHANPTASYATHELEELTHVRGRVLERCVEDLATAGLVRWIDREGTRALQYGPREVSERRDVDALAQMYHQRPVTLVKFVYEQPSTPLRSFSDAFRVRAEDER